MTVMTSMAFSAYASPDTSDTSSQLNITLHDCDATSMYLTNGRVDERASEGSILALQRSLTAQRLLMPSIGVGSISIVEHQGSRVLTHLRKGAPCMPAAME